MEKRKIGIVAPNGATTKARYSKVIPDVDLVLSTFSGRGLTQDDLDSEKRAMDEVAAATPDCIAYTCTINGALRGYAGDQAFIRREQERLGRPVTSTMFAATEALNHLGLHRVVVIGPYPDELLKEEHPYMEEAGIEAVVLKGMGLEGGYFGVTPEQIVEFGLQNWDDKADGLFVSCMAMDGMAALQTLEDRIHKPVVTSHSATLWRSLSLAGIDEPIEGYGTLLAQRRVANPVG